MSFETIHLSKRKINENNPLICEDSRGNLKPSQQYALKLIYFNSYYDKAVHTLDDIAVYYHPQRIVATSDFEVTNT